MKTRLEAGDLVLKETSLLLLSLQIKLFLMLVVLMLVHISMRKAERPVSRQGHLQSRLQSLAHNCKIAYYETRYIVWSSNQSSFYLSRILTLNLWPRSQSYNKEIREFTKKPQPQRRRLFTCVIILCTFLCRPPQRNNAKWPNSALCGKRLRRRIVFNIYISNFALFSILFSFNKEKQTKWL